MRVAPLLSVIRSKNIKIYKSAGVEGTSISANLVNAVLCVLTWVIDVTELVTRNQLDVNILRNGGEGDL